MIGYYGAMARWLDYELIKNVARLRPNYQFVLVGPALDDTLAASGLLKSKNVHWLGAITPLGGISFIAGWLWLLAKAATVVG